MAFPEGCLDDPNELWERRFCVHNVSKDAHGNLGPPKSDWQQCGGPQCQTLKTLQSFRVDLQSHQDCDSKLGSEIDGRLLVDRLVTAFDVDGTRRGVHAGDFEWVTNGGATIIRGRISGITNAGTHREPIFEPCERCHQPGVLAGRLCGEVVETPIPELRDAKVVALYKVRYHPSPAGGHGDVQGTLEGVVVTPCQEPG